MEIKNITTSNVFFGFALADSMFAAAGNCRIQRTELTPEQVREMARDGVLKPCLNPSHEATIAAMRGRYGIDIAIPDSPPKVAVNPGDSVVVMGVRGLPRLTDRHEYTEEEVAAATFSFTRYDVLLE